MTSPRHEVFEPMKVGVYHCISRCVRRAFLCGLDSYSGMSFEHRRQWIRERLAFLIENFSFELIAYAVMTNHLHTLIRNRPDLAANWSDEEVARRWRRVFPLRWENGRPAELNQQELEAITSDPELVTQYRDRLCSISWFNRCLCEHIAHRANQEDKCTGRFWEGRFKSPRVHDLCGLLACGVYIDLNPIRAKIATTPEGSDYTSIQDRIRAQTETSVGPINWVKFPGSPKLITIEDATGGCMTTSEYLSLVDVTGRLFIEGKGNIPNELEELLVRLRIKPSKWLDTSGNCRHRFRRLVGPVDALKNAAAKIGKRWFHGLAAARAAFC